MRRQPQPEDAEKVAAMYRAGHGVRAIARTLGCRTPYVSNLLEQAGIPRQPFGNAARSFTDEREREIAAAYAAGESILALARKHRVSHPTIRAALQRQGQDRRPRDAPRFWTPERTAEAIRRWKAGETKARIAREMGTSEAGVYYTLNNAGVTTRREWKPRPMPPARFGADNNQWQGGRSVTAQGYVLVAPPEEDRHLAGHLRAGGYVLEHRLVMARKLGRPLRRGETVHHRNGVKDDNRPENLQLRSSDHGQGVVLMCLDCGSANVGHGQV